MEKVQAFKAHDGTLFLTQEQAEEYEGKLKWDDLIKEFANHPLCPYPNTPQRQLMAKSIVAWERYRAGAKSV